MLKVFVLNRRIRRIESHIMVYRFDMSLKNELYYCGLGDVELWCENYCSYLYWKIAVCNRLISWYRRKLVGGGNSSKNFRLTPEKF